MINLLLDRTGFGSPKATEGELLLDGVHECWTVEDVSRGLRADMALSEILRIKILGETAIPTGVFGVMLYHSPRHGPDTLQLVGVPGFSNAQIHIANDAEDLEGCIGVGTERTSPDDDWVGQSAVALVELKAKIVPRMKAGESCMIEVRETR